MLRAGQQPPILAGDRPIATSGPLVLESADGTPFAAFEATPKGDAASTVLVLPDVAACTRTTRS